MDRDNQIRTAAFAWLRLQTDLHGDVLPWDLLVAGFEFEGVRVPLVSMQGIFKPKVLPEIPLSIRSALEGPYDDQLSTGGLLHYKYRGTERSHRDNVGLRRAMAEGKPLVYFYGLLPGKYLAVWPVFVVQDDPASLTFTVVADDAEVLQRDVKEGTVTAETRIRREYVTALTRRRVHQRAFRARVLNAYKTQCAMCRLRHEQLLDAAHIIEDARPLGDPHIENGLALCKIHHAAFERNILGIRPDYRIVVREDVRRESDGPMLLHGIQDLHEKRLTIPTRLDWRPSPERLEVRFEEFRRAG